jgi:nucleotide-binding universal stress UspA family protein
MVDSRSTVLACIDGSTYSEGVVDYAAWVSRTVLNPLKLLHIIERQYVPPHHDLSGSIGLGTREWMLEEFTEKEAERSRFLLKQGQLALDQAVARAARQEAFSVSTLQQHGSLSESLVELEEEIRVLVLGIRGEDHETKEKELGAQLETVIRSMHRPVLVVNRPFTEPPKRIMVAYDGSHAARIALDMVSTSPLYRGMECHLVHVVKDVHEDANLIDEAAKQLADADLKVVRATFLEGDVDKILQEYQRDKGIDMTVMGAFGHGRLRELLFGSVTIKMLCNSEVPLLLLR